MVKKLLKRITDVEMGIALAALGVVIASNAAEIFLRFFLGKSLVWVQDVNLLLMVWMIFPGVAKIVHDKKDIVVTMLVDKLPARARSILDIASDILIIAFFIVLTKYSCQLFARQIGSTTATVRIPLVYYTSAVVLNCVTIAAIYLNELAVKFTALKKKEGAE